MEFKPEWDAFVAAFRTARSDFSTAKKIVEDAKGLGEKAAQMAEDLGLAVDGL